MLRHTAATLWLEAGIPDHVRQDALGHMGSAMTQRYTHLTPNLQQEMRDRLGAYREGR
jgi:integrase